MKGTMILLVKIALSLTIAAAGAIWLMRGISGGHPIYAEVEIDLRSEETRLMFRDLDPDSHERELPDTGQSKDHWGNPYRHIRPDQPGPDGSRFFIYSLGQDGRSASGGHDPDDINSWDKHHRAHYDHGPWFYRVIRGLLLLTCWTVASLPAFGILHAVQCWLEARWSEPATQTKPAIM